VRIARPTIYLIATAVCGLASFPAMAQTVDAAAVVKQVCAGRKGLIDRARLADSLLTGAGVLGSDLARDATLGSNLSYDERALAAVRLAKVEGVPQAAFPIRRLVQRLEQDLVAGGGKVGDLTVTGVPLAGYDWLFDPNRAFTLSCGSASSSPNTEGPIPLTRHPALVLRQKVEELSLTASDAKKAGAFNIGALRVRSIQEDGSIKKVTTITAAGTLGIRLTSPTTNPPVFAYAGYALNRQRTLPGKTFDEQAKDDVNALEVGGSIGNIWLRDAANWNLTMSGNIAYVRDFAHDASRGRFRLLLTPGIAANLGPFCGLGGFNRIELSFISFRGRCVIALDAEASNVFKAGTAKGPLFATYDDFIGLGTNVGYQVAVPIKGDDGLLGGVLYRFVPTISGKASDIERLDISFKYRIWVEDTVGIDFGIVYQKGTEPISLVKEDRFQLGFGVIF